MIGSWSKHMNSLFDLIDDKTKLSWLESDSIRPYVYVRNDNKIINPGSYFDVDWFHTDIVRKDPLKMDDVHFANLILDLEHKAFEKSDMPMPRWVFYDCAIIPGFVAGFAIRRDQLTQEMVSIYPRLQPDQEWIPISLFIIIPTMAENEWVAHNLCSINSMIDRKNKFYGLGFLTKAFALWYANIKVQLGMTQWTSPALRLHSHYGEFEILTAYTPVHDYAETLTYRLKVDPHYWDVFFKKNSSESFESRYLKSDISVVRTQSESLKLLQRLIEMGKGPFYLRPSELRAGQLQDSLSIYLPK